MVVDSFHSEMQQALQEQRAVLETELAHQLSQTTADDAHSEHAGLGNHMADDATDLFEQEKDLALQQHTAQLLEKVNRALRRLNEGAYGLCESCGQPIDRARLQTLPHAALCVSCKARQEKA
jgi:DnaK suppressor protein